MNKEELLTDAEVFNYHGYKEQCKHITSELHELTSAIYEYELVNEQTTAINAWNNIVEEVADVEFMLNQIKEKYLIMPQNVDAWKGFKRKRESKRIKEGFYDKQRSN